MAVPKQKPGQSWQEYSTPHVFIAAVKRRLGIRRFAYDLAASSENTKAAVYFTKTQDALRQNWVEAIKKAGKQERIFYFWRWGWLNPPFTDIAPWAKKCWEESQRGGRIALLVPASVGANWFRDWVHGKAEEVLFLNGRLAFIPEKPAWLYPKDCMLVSYKKSFYAPSCKECGTTTFYSVWNWRKEP